MNTISAIAPAQTPAPNAGGATVASASGGAAGLFQALLGGLLVPAQAVIADGAQALPSDAVSDDDSETSSDAVSAEVPAATPVMPGILGAMQPVLPVAVAAEATVVLPSATIAPPIDAAAIENGEEAVELKTSMPMPVAAATDSNGASAEQFLVTNGAAISAPGESPAPAVASLESVIQAAAANIGRSTERAFAGRRLDGPAVTGEKGSSALQAIDSDAASVEETGFTRVAVNAAVDAESQQAASEGGSELLGDEASKTGDTATKPTDAFKGLFGAETRPEIGNTAGVAPPKLDGAIAVHRNAVPESVSVREVGDVVVRSVHYLSGKTDEVVTLRLVPRSLGELQIAVRHAANGIEVVMTAANAAAREALEGHVAGLRDALMRDGMDAPRVTIQVAAHFDAAYQPPLGGQGQQDTANPAPRHGHTAYREPADSGAQERQQQQTRRQRHDGRLNMWV